jgi:N-acetylmuramate 1-kinase
MDPAASPALAEWAAATVARLWPGARVGALVALKGDASTRRFFRVSLAEAPRGPRTAILVDLGPDDLPRYVRALKLLRARALEPPWLNVHRFLSDLGAPVPVLYAADAHRVRAMLVEDVGERALFDAAAGHRTEAADLYRLAIEQLLVLHVDGTRRLDRGCIASQIAYDERLFAWEMKEFLELGCAAVAPGTDPRALEPELGDLAARLGRLPRVFSHRDYHGWNLFVQDGANGASRLRIIDFQDALMAPAAQDLAVLLTTRDTARVIAPALERRLLEFYYTGLVRRRAEQLSAGEFFAGYRLCVLQHALKMTGRFIWFERGGKPGYARYVPDAVAQARRILAGPEGDMFPKLRAALERGGNARP